MDSVEVSSPVFCCQEVVCTNDMQTRGSNETILGPLSSELEDMESYGYSFTEDEDRIIPTALAAMKSFIEEVKLSKNSMALFPQEVINTILYKDVLDSTAHLVSIRTCGTTKRVPVGSCEHRWYMRCYRNDKLEWMELPVSFKAIHSGRRFYRIDDSIQKFECKEHKKKFLIHFWKDKKKSHDW